MKKRRWVIGSVAGVAAAALIALLVIPAEIRRNQPPSVKTVPAIRGDVEQWYSATGRIRSGQVKTYMPSAGASFQKILVTAGDRVAAGQKLAELDLSSYEKLMKQTETACRTAENSFRQFQEAWEDYQSRLSSLEEDISRLQEELEQDGKEEAAALEETRELVRRLLEQINTGDGIQDTGRLEELLDAQRQNSGNAGDKQLQLLGLQLQKYVLEAQGSSYSSTALNQLQDSASSARSAYEESRRAYDEAAAGITAEFAGIVSEVGEASSLLGSSGITVKADTELYAEISLGKYDISRVKEGQEARIAVPGASFSGQVVSVSAIAQVSTSLTGASSSVVTAKIRIDAPKSPLLIDYDCDVDVLLGKDTGTVLAPVEAIRSDNGGDYCYRVVDGVVERAAVQLGYSSDAYTAVYDGIEEGDLLVNNPTADISAGVRVTPETGKAG